MRFIFMVLENYVTGDANYDHRNYYNTTVGHPCYQLGDTIPDYVHKYILRGLPSGLTGNIGVIPTSVTKSSSYSEDFTFTLPDSFDENRVSLIGIVANYGVYVEKKMLSMLHDNILQVLLILKELKRKSGSILIPILQMIC